MIRIAVKLLADCSSDCHWKEPLPGFDLASEAFGVRLKEQTKMKRRMGDDAGPVQRWVELLKITDAAGLRRVPFW